MCKCGKCRCDAIKNVSQKPQYTMLNSSYRTNYINQANKINQELNVDMNIYEQAQATKEQVSSLTTTRNDYLQSRNSSSVDIGSLVRQSQLLSEKDRIIPPQLWTDSSYRVINRVPRP